jgi:hypothetical protein
VEITDEMRRAVLGELCAKIGHNPNYSATITVRPGDDRMQVGAPDELQMPHMSCSRCRQVLGIVLPVTAWSYEDAERIVYGLLRADTEPARAITRNRWRREERDRPPDELTPAEPAALLAAEEPARPKQAPQSTTTG